MRHSGATHADLMWLKANRPHASSSLLKNPLATERGLMIYFVISNRRGRSCAAGDQGGLFSYIAPDKRVPANHPLRKVRELVRDVLSDLNRSLGKLYASEGRPSIPPEQLLSALLLQCSTASARNAS